MPAPMASSALQQFLSGMKSWRSPTADDLIKPKYRSQVSDTLILCIWFQGSQSLQNSWKLGRRSTRRILHHYIQFWLSIVCFLIWRCFSPIAINTSTQDLRLVSIGWIMLRLSRCAWTTAPCDFNYSFYWLLLKYCLSRCWEQKSRCDWGQWR
jgi:hypothetical protein